MKATTSAASTSAPAHNAPLPPSSTSARAARIAPHSHIKSLGLTPEGYASQTDNAGFIGQVNAREVRVFSSLFFPWPFSSALWLHVLRSSAHIGMWRRRRSRQVTKVLWPRPPPRRCPRHRQDRTRARNCPRAGYKSPFLPHGGLRGVQYGGEEDGSTRGGVPQGDRCVSVISFLMFIS